MGSRQSISIQLSIYSTNVCHPCMLCPFAIVERLSNVSRHSYGVLKLSDDTIMKDIRSLDGCKISLFLSMNSGNIDAFVDTDNIEVVLCKDGISVAPDLVLYGTALLRRRMPVRLLQMREVLSHAMPDKPSDIDGHWLQIQELGAGSCASHVLWAFPARVWG
jgi:hypothetical protein